MADKKDSPPTTLAEWGHRVFPGPPPTSLQVANAVALWLLVIFVFIIFILAAVGVSRM